MPQDRSKQTSCKDCTFALYNNITQYGCMANRLEKFKDSILEAYDQEKEFYVINRKCNLFRTNKWNNGIADVELANTESSISFDLLIDCDDANNDYIEKIKKEITNLNYPNKRVKIVLYHSRSSSSEIRLMMSEIYRFFPMVTISVYFYKEEFLHDLIMKSKNRFHIFIDKNNVNDISSFLHKINNTINLDMIKVVLYVLNSKKAILNSAYKYICLSTETTDYASIVDRLTNEAKQQNLYIET